MAVVDFFVDWAGVVHVRGCGCGKHGATSFWTDHSEEWRKEHAAEAEAKVEEFRLRWPDQTERFANASALVRKDVKPDAR